MKQLMQIKKREASKLLKFIYENYPDIFISFVNKKAKFIRRTNFTRRVKK